MLLALESSCDETSVAIVHDGRVLANVVASQIKLHAEYGGVVPELATREHLRNLIPVTTAALQGANAQLAQLTAIRATRADALFLPGYYVEAGLAAQQSRELGLRATLLGGDGFEAPQLIEIGGPALEGTVYSTHYSAENQDPASRRFVAAYQARHGSVPVGLAALSYDSVQLVADAARRAGTTERVALKQALAATRDFPGITGRTTLNDQRDAIKDAAIITVRGGRCVFTESIRP